MKQTLKPGWTQGKLPAPPAKGWSLPKLHAAAAAAASLIEQAEGGYMTAIYWLLGRCLLAAERQSKSPADFFSWRASLGIPPWRRSRAISFAKAYRTQDEAAKKTVKEAEDRVRDLRAKAGQKVHGSRFSLPVKVNMAAQAVTAIEVGLPKVKDAKILAVEIRRLREIADVLNRLLAKYGPKIAAA